MSVNSDSYEKHIQRGIANSLGLETMKKIVLKLNKAKQPTNTLNAFSKLEKKWQENMAPTYLFADISWVRLAFWIVTFDVFYTIPSMLSYYPTFYPTKLGISQTP